MSDAPAESAPAQIDPAQTDPAEQPVQILPRERSDIPDAVARIPRPPVPHLDPPFALRVARLGDADMVAEWMNRPHLAAAWEYDWPTRAGGGIWAPSFRAATRCR